MHTAVHGTELHILLTIAAVLIPVVTYLYVLMIRGDR